MIRALSFLAALAASGWQGLAQAVGPAPVVRPPTLARTVKKVRKTRDGVYSLGNVKVTRETAFAFEGRVYHDARHFDGRRYKGRVYG